MPEPPLTRLEPDWLTTQYDNRARVPGYAQILERWARDSRIARDRSARRLDIAYGADPAERLDVFPCPRSDAPVLVFIHGGWWRALDKSDSSFVAPAFTREGAMVVVPNYSLAPRVNLETIAIQLTRAVAWVYNNAGLYGGDRNRIVIAGHSAGGHLAAMLMSCDWAAVQPELPRDFPIGGLAISGLFDLEPLRQTPFLQADLRLDVDSVRRLSPAFFPAPAKPLYAAVGADESEEFLRQTTLIREAWGENAVPVCERIAGVDHFSVLDDLIEPHGRLHGLALRLLGLAVSQSAS
jgi:arylformamidase